MKQVVLLGSTGSIGTQAEQVCLEDVYKRQGVYCKCKGVAGNGYPVIYEK